MWLYVALILALLIIIVLLLFLGRKRGIYIVPQRGQRVGGAPDNYDKMIPRVLPPVEQGDCNACWAIATCQTVSDRMRARGIISSNDQLNYNAFHDLIIQVTPDHDSCGNGALLETGMDMFTRHGAPLMSQTQDRRLDDRSYPGDAQARMYRTKGWRKIGPDVGSIKQELANGPVVAVINLYNSFYDFVGSGIYRPRVGESVDSGMAHMISVVGYDDRDQSWIIRNSYGPSFGNRGFVKVRWNDPSLDLENNVWAPIL